MPRGKFSCGIFAALFFMLSLNLIFPANAIMDGQAVQNSSRVVPIFILQNENDPQPTKTVAFTGFLYSSRIVFTAIPDFVFDSQGNQIARKFGAIYVGKPGSDIADTTGRVKVVKRFNSKQFRFEASPLEDFGILVLEKDLTSAKPYPLLTENMQAELARAVKVTGYGEYRDQCPPGAEPPCRENLPEPSTKPRTVTVNLLSLSEIETKVKYRQPQLRNQLIFSNLANPRAGAVCFGDSGAPIIGEYRFKRVYLGQMSSAVRVYGCGRGTNYDGYGGIHYASPVYKHVELIREAEAFVMAQQKVGAKSDVVSGVSLPSGTTTLALKTTSAIDHRDEKVEIEYEGNPKDLTSNLAGFRFYNGYEANLLQISQIPMSKAQCTSRSASKLKCSFPGFNPYTKIAIKKSGVVLHAAPYNEAGQGALSPPVTMHEMILKSIYKTIDFEDNQKVINDVFGGPKKNSPIEYLIGKPINSLLDYTRSRKATSYIKATFIFKGPKLEAGLVPKFLLNERNSSKDVWHEMRFDSYEFNKSENLHQFKLITRKKITFPGDSRFLVQLQISDRDGFVRAYESIDFTFGYNMNSFCAASLLANLSVKDAAKINLKTASTILGLVNEGMDTAFLYSKPPKLFLDFFKYVDQATFLAETGLLAIEVIEEEGDYVKFLYKFKDMAKIEIAEQVGKKITSRTLSPEAGSVVKLNYEFSMTAKDGVDFLANYVQQIDDWSKANGEDVVKFCGRA